MDDGVTPWTSISRLLRGQESGEVRARTIVAPVLTPDGAALGRSQLSTPT